MAANVRGSGSLNTSFMITTTKMLIWQFCDVEDSSVFGHKPSVQ